MEGDVSSPKSGTHSFGTDHLADDLHSKPRHALAYSRQLLRSYLENVLPIQQSPESNTSRLTVENMIKHVASSIGDMTITEQHELKGRKRKREGSHSFNRTLSYDEDGGFGTKEEFVEVKGVIRGRECEKWLCEEVKFLIIMRKKVELELFLTELIKKEQQLLLLEEKEREVKFRNLLLNLEAELMKGVSPADRRSSNNYSSAYVGVVKYRGMGCWIAYYPYKESSVQLDSNFHCECFTGLVSIASSIPMNHSHVNGGIFTLKCLPAVPICLPALYSYLTSRNLPLPSVSGGITLDMIYRYLRELSLSEPPTYFYPSTMLNIPEYMEGISIDSSIIRHDLLSSLHFSLPNYSKTSIHSSESECTFSKFRYCYIDNCQPTGVLLHQIPFSCKDDLVYILGILRKHVVYQKLFSSCYFSMVSDEEALESNQVTFRIETSGSPPSSIHLLIHLNPFDFSFKCNTKILGSKLSLPVIIYVNINISDLGVLNCAVSWPSNQSVFALESDASDEDVAVVLPPPSLLAKKLMETSYNIPASLNSYLEVLSEWRVENE